MVTMTAQIAEAVGRSSRTSPTSVLRLQLKIFQHRLLPQRNPTTRRSVLLGLQALQLMEFSRLRRSRQFNLQPGLHQHALRQPEVTSFQLLHCDSTFQMILTMTSST